MADEEKDGPVWPWVVWGVLLALWTWGLVSPSPPQVSEWLLPPYLRYAAAKTLHFTAYAVLSLLVAWLPARRPVLIALWVLLFVHAGVTEWAQTFVNNRTGSPYDVAINSAGILTGLLAAALLRSRRN
jgi:hypothetical protein